MHVCTLVCVCNLAAIFFFCSPCPEQSPLLINALLPCCTYTSSHFLPTRRNNFFCSFFCSSLLPSTIKTETTFNKKLACPWAVHITGENSKTYVPLSNLLPLLRRKLHHHITHSICLSCCISWVGFKYDVFSPKSSCPSVEHNRCGTFLLYTATVTEMYAGIKGIALIMQDAIASLPKRMNMSPLMLYTHTLGN